MNSNCVRVLKLVTKWSKLCSYPVRLNSLYYYWCVIRGSFINTILYHYNTIYLGSNKSVQGFTLGCIPYTLTTRGKSQYTLGWTWITIISYGNQINLFPCQIKGVLHFQDHLVHCEISIKCIVKSHYSPLAQVECIKIYTHLMSQSNLVLHVQAT